MTVMILFLLILVVLVIGVMLYNGLVGKREEVENAWSQIDVQLKRRHDLIPNLVETVKGYASHERQTLENVIAARSAATAAAGTQDIAGRSQAENMLTGALRQLFALSESYPDLKANQNFAQLQEEITSTENRIGFARQHYNDSVAVYNTAIETIPSNIVAGVGGFTSRQYFELDAQEAEEVRKVPSVSFQ